MYVGMINSIWILESPTHLSEIVITINVLLIMKTYKRNDGHYKNSFRWYI